MGKVIIDNRSHLTDQEAVRRVERVMDMGRISKWRGRDCYCLASTFMDDTVVLAFANKASDSFRIEDESKADG